MSNESRLTFQPIPIPPELLDPATDPSNLQLQRRVGLGVKATVFALVLSTIPVAVMGLIGYQVAGQEKEQQIEATQRILAEQVASELSNFMFERYGDIQVLARLPLFTDPELRDLIGIAGEENFLDSYLTSYGDTYNSISLMDINGDDIAVSGEFAHSNHSDDEYFQAAIRGDIYIGQPGYSSSTDTIVIYVAAPVYDSITGDLFGVVRTRLLADTLLDLVEIPDDTNTIHLADNQGIIFASTKREEDDDLEAQIDEDESTTPEVVGRNIDESFTDLASVRINSPSGFVDTREVGEDNEDLLGFAATPPIATMSDLGWTALVEVNADIAYRSVDELGSAFVFGTVITMLLAGLAAALLVPRALKPIESATAAVERIGQGYLDVRLPVMSQDEVGILSTNINRMAAQLQQVLSEVQSQSEQLQQKNDQIESESNLLQHDVSHLLDVVSAVEEGDLTTRALVGEGATGLVADTLNRLIEELTRILGTTLTSASQVTVNAREVEQLATRTAQQAQQQADSVEQVRYLMEAVTSQAATATQQAGATESAVAATQEAVVQGQDQIRALTQGIGSLQDGSDQIVRRVNTLNDYIDLAAQFSKEQKRIAALTRVLALNASTLAARALGQEDPDQFASIAHEFETIAGQVSELAIQTNQGLQVLQQRTNQIQTVVSGLNQDVDDISTLVQGFTASTDQSRQAFENIRSVTQQVSDLGRQMADSSQAIVDAATTTLNAIGDIATTATNTDTQARLTREQATAMQSLATQLLQLVQFFRLGPDYQVDPHLSTPQFPENGTGSDARNGQDLDLAVPESDTIEVMAALR